MRTLCCEEIVSSDGYFEGPDGKFGWAVPDGALHAYVNKRQDEFDTYILGRRMYEVMRFWDDVATDNIPEVEAEFAWFWQTKAKLVASNAACEHVAAGLASQKRGSR